MYAGGLRQFIQRDLVLFQPLPIGLATGQLALQFVIGNNAALLQIDEEHLAGLQATAAFDVLGLHGQHTGFGRQHHHIVMRDHVAGGPQTVAVQRGTNHTAIGKRDGGGAVPRLH